MSGTDASEENVKSPSTYGKKATKSIERRKKKKKNKTNVEKESINMGIRYSKFAVGGESKEVPASLGLDENDNPIHRREQNKQKQKNSRNKN